MIKMTFKIQALIFISILTFLFSCKKSEKYSNSFSVKNDTKYKIENIEFKLSDSKKTLTINPHSTSDTFTLNYENTPTFPGDASLELTYFIDTFSDSSKTYKNTVGHTYPQNKLKSNNIVTIKVDPAATANDIFTLTFN